MDKEFKLSSNQFYQRKLKYKKIKETFDSLDVRYIPQRDVFHVYEFDKLIYACYGYKNTTEIIEDINSCKASAHQ